MSERDPFETLGDLIGQPVEPRAEFADRLRLRLMSELSTSQGSREEQLQPMDAMLTPRPPLAFPTESSRRIRSKGILQLAATAIIVLGLAAALSRGWFQNEPDAPTSVPAAAWLGDETPTPATNMEQAPTSAPNSMVPTMAPEGSTPAPNSMVPTMAPEGSTPAPNSNDTIPTVSSERSLEPTAAPPDAIPGTIWALPGDGSVTNFGGLLIENDSIYRLIALSDFIGIQAIDAATGAVKWQQAYQWTGNLFAIEAGTLFFDGGYTTLVAVDAETGAEKWRAHVPGNPIDLVEDGNHVFVLLDSDYVAALDSVTGDQLWVAQGQIPQNPTGGSTSIPAMSKIATGSGVVAAVSTYGVLSGFDAQTGRELWAHEGYDAASTTIESKGDHLVVSSGSGFSTLAVRVGSLDSSEASSSSTQCAQYFQLPVAVGTVTAGVPGTAESGASASHMPGGAFRVQAIDQRTGDILWEQHVISGAAVATVVAANAGNPVMCIVDAETGAIGMDFGTPTTVTVGAPTNSGGMAQMIQTESGVFVEVGVIDGLDPSPIAVTVADGFAYLQLADGMLVKVASNSPGDGR